VSSHLDFWRPSKRQLETLAECACARLDTARTARLLGVSEPVFVAWVKRLAAASAEEERAIAAFPARPRRVAHELAEASAFGGGLP
jgi:DNA-binding transcriptional regulator YdaS (Cro superfamily)